MDEVEAPWKGKRGTVNHPLAPFPHSRSLQHSVFQPQPITDRSSSCASSLSTLHAAAVRTRTIVVPATSLDSSGSRNGGGEKGRHRVNARRVLQCWMSLWTIGMVPVPLHPGPQKPKPTNPTSLSAFPAPFLNMRCSRAHAEAAIAVEPRNPTSGVRRASW